jgi:ABC-type uncharacterized transport system substrate-binding protein
LRKEAFESAYAAGYIKVMKKFAVLVALIASPLGAHPHIFVDVGIEGIVDAKGRLTQVKVTWAYDALFSLLITEDAGLDKDGDAVLTPQEEAQLVGFDANWTRGYNGDLVGQLNGRELTLSRPKSPTAIMREGRIVTTHLRDVAGRPMIAGKVIEFRPFDPTYYTAYDVTMGVRMRGVDGCEVQMKEPDLNKEMQELQGLLAQLGQEQDSIEMGFPEVGASFATTIVITCAPS